LHNILLWFFLCNEVLKIKPSFNPGKLTLGRINWHSFNNVLSRISGTKKINQKLNIDNYCTSINVKLAFFIIFVLTLQNGFAARWCFWFSANDSSIEKVCPPLVILCVKKHKWKWSIAANKTHFLQPMLPLKVHKCAEAYYQTIRAVKSHLALLQYSKSFEKHENKKLFELNMLFVRIFMILHLFQKCTKFIVHLELR